MTKHDKIINWIENTAIKGKWYAIKPGAISDYKSCALFIENNLEITFKNDYSKIKINHWPYLKNDGRIL